MLDHFVELFKASSSLHVNKTKTVFVQFLFFIFNKHHNQKQILELEEGGGKKHHLNF